MLGMCGQSVHERLQRMGIDTRPAGSWEPWQLESLKVEYAKKYINLENLALRIGKLRSNVCRKARELGLTNQSRKERSKYGVSKSQAELWLQEFEQSQPLTLREFSEGKGLWPYGLSRVFFRFGLLERAREISRSRCNNLEYIRKKFERNFVKEDGCWEWLAYRNRDGYGRFRALGTSIAHRASWIIYRGDPGRLLVCHRCDNPPCVNPDHLFLGTAKDAMRKGRLKKWKKIK
jgi:hypothetical protein